MFTDARSFWTSASSAIATINENISTALDKIDADIDGGEEDGSVKEVVDQLKADLETYKSMLEDAQMQHFELSKQSRILVAEKEAELQHYKQAASGGEVSNADDSLKFKKLLAEKMILDASLREAQEQLSAVLHEKNDYLVMKKTHEEVMARFQNVKSDLTSMKVDTDSKEKDRNETIENLVAEYSKLAAETELYQQQADKRVSEVMRENEILVTKMHALEHSITELADRSVAPSPVPPMNHGGSTPGGSKNASRAELNATPTSFAGNDSELREARSKIVNLQFDIKEKEDMISKLKASLSAAQETHSTPVQTVAVAVDPSLATGDADALEAELANMTVKLREEMTKSESSERILAKLQTDLDNQARDLSRLIVEKKEADEAGRRYHEQYKAAQQQFEALVRSQRQQQEATVAEASAAVDGAGAAAEVALAAAKEVQVVLQGEIDQLKQEVASLQQQRTDVLAVADASQSELASAKQAESQLLSELGLLKEQLAALQSQHADTLSSASAASEVAFAAAKQAESQLQSEVNSLKAQIVSIQGEHSAVVGASGEAGAALEAARAQQAQLHAQVESLTQQIATLTAEHSAAVSAKDQSASETIAQLTATRETALAALRAELEDQHAKFVADKEGSQSQSQIEHATQLAQAAAEHQQLLEAAQQVSAAQVAQIQAEKDLMARQVEEKVTEIAAMKAQHDAQIQASLSGSDSERQNLVADYMRQIDTLQAELTTAQGDCEAKTKEIGALEVQLSEANANITSLQTQTEALNGQLSDATKAAVEQATAHAGALAAQTQEAEAALNAAVEEQQALYAQLQKDMEDTISVLRDSHREELLGELDHQKQELDTAHAAALEQALAQASSEAAVALVQSLEDQKNALEGQAAAQLTAAQETHAQDKAAALAENTVRHEAQQAEALTAQAAIGAAHLATALEQLTAEKDSERSAALEELRAAKQAEHDSAVAACQAHAENEMQAAQTDFAAKIAVLDARIASLKAELTSVEDKYKAITAAALASLESQKEAEKTAALAALRAELKGEIEAAHRERDEHLENYSKERKLRKKIHNRLLEIQGNIRVLCRIRPILEVERRSGEDVDITEVPNEEELYVQRDQQSRTRYEYDRVFPQHSTQEEVFEAVQPLCVSVLDGYNVCIFAYGQTGSGKTFTMEGSAGNKGVSPRAIQELLNQVESVKETNVYTVTLSMLEIYNETILDLLPLNGTSNGKEREKLEIRQTGDGGNQVVGLTETIITSMAQVEDLMKQGQRNRAVGSHDMNEHSSRSHSIITLVARGKNVLDGTTTYGKLHLIDLAGSERVGKTDATGDRLKEAQNINKSLSALGEVINALGNKKATHVPYRNSKLTFLLQDSLGGNSKVLTFVNISPAVYNLGETVCSLNFATRCRSTELGQAKKQSAAAGEESASKPSVRRVISSTSTSSLNSSGMLTPASKR